MRTGLKSLHVYIQHIYIYVRLYRRMKEEMKRDARVRTYLITPLEHLITYRLEMWTDCLCHVYGDLEPLELNRESLGERRRPSEISTNWIRQFQNLLRNVRSSGQEIRWCWGSTKNRINMRFITQSNVIDNVDNFFYLLSFTCFGQNRPSSAGFFMNKFVNYHYNVTNIELVIIFYA
jgi:hypothetical protein